MNTPDVRYCDWFHPPEGSRFCLHCGKTKEQHLGSYTELLGILKDGSVYIDEENTIVA